MKTPRFVAFILFVVTCTGLTRAAERKPNFLFIYTDDQRWDAMGVVQREMGERGRYPWFTTPAMDRLAAEGMRFRNAFVTLSLCAPSRAAFLTGRYNHLNGIANNHTPFPETSVTHATLLRVAGYTTGYVGKWHMGNQRGQRPGFDYSASFVGQGRYVDCPVEINGEATPTKGWIDDVSTDYAIAFMQQNRAKPFSLIVGFKACHGPTTPPERAANRFADQNARRVPNLGLRAPFRDEADIPATKNAAPAASANANEVPVNLNYFRCVSAADDCLGRLLATLDELGLAEDTVVVFTSDNGYYQGEHSLGDKRSLYDESLRIPLLVRYPRAVARGKVADDLVLNVDLAPTFLDLAGVAVPAEMQGRSWRSLMAPGASAAPWRRAFLAEYFQETGYPQTPTMVAVRTTNAKLIKYTGHDDWTELFDLAADPYETKNLARDPARAALLTQMKAEFDRETKAVAYTIPTYADDPTKDDTAGKKKGGKNQKKSE